MEIITHNEFINNLNKISITDGEYKFLNILFNIHFELGFKTESFYKKDSYLIKVSNCCKDTIRDRRKTLSKKGYLKVGKSQNGIVYTINYDKILNTSTEEEPTSSISKKREKQTNTPTEVKDKGAAPKQETKPLPIIELLPPTPLTEPKTEEIETIPTPQPKEKKEINLEGIFSEFERVSPQNDITIPNNTKVPEITQNHPLNEDEHKEDNLPINKDNNINENNEDMEEKVTIGVIDNILSAFTKEELSRWQKLISDDNPVTFVSEARERVEKYATKSRIKQEYVWGKLFNYVTNTNFEDITPVENTESEIDLDVVPEWVWTTLTKVYTYKKEETIKNKWGEYSQVTNTYLRPIDTIKPLYKLMMQSKPKEDKDLINQYAKVVYDDCAFAYKEYDKETAA